MDIKDKYYIKNLPQDRFRLISTLFNGVRVLAISGFGAKGKAVNVYTAQWVDEQEEDFLITTIMDERPIVIRENVDLSLTFIVGNRYATGNIDVRNVHDNFIRYISGSDVWIKSLYYDKAVHCMMLDAYEPTTVKLKRGGDSYIIGTVKLHALDTPYVD